MEFNDDDGSLPSTSKSEEERIALLSEEQFDNDQYYSTNATDILAECDRCVLSDQRVFYLHRKTRRSYWIPPKVAWQCQHGLHYGIERCIDEFGTYYFANHLRRTTSYSYEHHRTNQMSNASVESNLDSNQMVVPPTRSYEIWKSPKYNYGFIASSERPVVVQFVTPGGPSDGRLLPKDQILSVNGIDVRQEDKLAVVEMIRKSTVLKLEVSQPPRKLENGGATSRRVKFSEHIVISGHTEVNKLPNFPNVLKVYMENGQIKSLRYNKETTVQDILLILMEKLHITQPDHFALAVEQSISMSPACINFLPSKLRIQALMSMSHSHQIRCRLRLAFAPRELLSYSKDDPHGFEYFYQQCVNDFVDGRHMEIRYEASLRLAALHIRQVCTETTASKSFNRTNVHYVEREYGLATFLPTIWLEKVKPRDLREHLQFFLNKDEETFNDLRQYLAKQKAMNRTPEFLTKNPIDVSADIARIIRIKYVTLISLLPDFGTVYFNVNYKPTEVDMIIQIDSRYGIVVRYPGKNSPPAITINFTSIDSIHVYEENEMISCVCLKLTQSNVNAAQRNLEFFVDKKDVDNLITYIMGYAKLIGNKTLEYREEKPLATMSAPPYSTVHFVSPAGWNYLQTVDPSVERAVNFAAGPPTFDQATVSSNKYDNSLQVDEPEFSVLRRISKHSLTEPEFIDESPVVEMNPMPRSSFEKYKILPPNQQRRRSSQQRFTQMLVGTAQAILLRNKATTKRLRDSLRIHRQRHSLPNANAVRTASPIAERRWSSATRRDTIASTCSTNENPLISRSALILRPSLDNIATNGGNLLDSSAKSHSIWSNRPLKLPKVVSRIHSNSERQEAVKVNPSTSAIKPTNPQKNRLVEELRRSWSLDEKHVRFDFSLNSTILPPPSPEPSITPDAYPIEKQIVNGDEEFFFQPYVTLCSKKFGQLSTSHTFPMDKNNTDFTEDFVPPSYQQPKPVNPEKPTVRRMSLKEFTGLENAVKPLTVPRHNSAAFQNGIGSPILSRLGTLSQQTSSTSRSNEYLDRCGRRRSSSGLYGSNFGSREHVYEPFDKVLDEISATVNGLNLESIISELENQGEIQQNIDPEQMLTKIDLARKRLSLTLEKMPPQSPKKKMAVDEERNKILVDVGKLSQASKRIIRSVYSPMNAKERQQNTMNTIALADSITEQCENLLEKRSSYYQAHLLKAELDQLLRTLAETIKDANLAVDKQRYGPEFRRLSKSSNSLAAAFTQFLLVIKTF